MVDKKKKLVVFTGAGISAESGLQTFLDSDGLWDGYNVYDVATPEAWRKNPGKVQEFYNLRRKKVLEALPNPAHKALVELEEKYEVIIITQNVDDLHERAGSSRVIHLHGLITQSRSSTHPELMYTIDGWEIKMGELCEKGSQLRPNVVWFGEAVDMIEFARDLCLDADIFVVIGTSLQVYPAAGLLDFVPSKADKYLVDPNAQLTYRADNFRIINATASKAVPQLVKNLIEKQ